MQADWSHTLDVLDAAYQVDQPLDAWQHGLMRALKPLIDRGFGFGMWLTDVSSPAEVHMNHPLNLGSPEEWFNGLIGYIRSLPNPAHQAMHRVGPVAFASIHNEVALKAVPAFRLFLDAVWRQRHHEERLATLNRGLPPPEAEGVARLIENFGVLALDATGQGIAFAAPMDHTVGTFPDKAELELWARLTGHIANAWRIKRELDARQGPAPAPEAVIAPGGKVEHAEGRAVDAAARTSLRGAVLAVERAHTRRHRLRGEEVTSAWRALVEGRWTVLETFEHGGRRYYVARPNEPTVRAPASLSQREAQIARYVALGHSNKMIAYELGLAVSTVANHIARAMRKLRVSTRAEMIRVTTLTEHGTYDGDGSGA